MKKKKVKRFDVWVTRNHYGDNFIRVSNTATAEITRRSGCTLFCHNGWAWGNGTISSALCLRRYGFLPQPATCWNVWTDAKGVIQHQEYPLLDKYTGRTYKPKPIASEKKYYL